MKRQDFYFGYPYPLSWDASERFFFVQHNHKDLFKPGTGHCFFLAVMAKKRSAVGKLFFTGRAMAAMAIAQTGSLRPE
ncbi:MAG TPA: hypothetical protein VKR53_19915 [Puia sp.]|nr:hypothetical protein [Puia sp.]